jgi:hypothetical protein
MPQQLVTGSRSCCLIIFIALIFTSAAFGQAARQSAFTIGDGEYQMVATYKFSDQANPIVNMGGTVTVKLKGKKLSIAVPVFPAPIEMKLAGNRLTGNLRNPAASITFQAEIVENDHAEGVFFGTFGPKAVTGIWTMRSAGAPRTAPLKGT